MGDLHPEHLNSEMQKECPSVKKTSWLLTVLTIFYQKLPMEGPLPSQTIPSFFSSASNLFSERGRMELPKPLLASFEKGVETSTVPPVGLPSALFLTG